MTFFSFIRKIISILHWIFYSLLLVPVIINAEIWFYGQKFNGDSALMITLSIGISGIILGYFIWKKQKISYYIAVGLFMITLIDVLVNHMTSGNL